MLRSLILTTLAMALSAQVPAPGPQAAPKPPAAPAAPKEDKVLATIGTEVTRESDFNMFLEVALPENQRRQMAMMPGARDQYLKRFLEYRVLAVKARKEGVQKSPDFASKMKLMEVQVLIQKLLERDDALLKAKSAIKDEEVKAYFDQHPDKFKTPETFSARHILISTRAQGQEKARTDVEALARVKEVQDALKAGKTFDELAKTYSDDPGSKDKGGLYENTPFGRFDPTFEKAVRGQELGKVGEPVKTGFGYHLIQAEKITPAVPMTFEAAKDSARQQASAERLEAVMTAYMDAAKKETGYHEGPKAPAAGKARKGAK